MAGDWISIDHELPDTAQVRGIYERTNAELDQIIGRLFFLWRLADAQTVDGRLEHTGPKTLARLCGGDQAFWEAVAAVGWVVFEDDAAIIPDFTKRFGASAKRRVLDARRAKQRRNADAVTTECRRGDDTTPTPRRQDDDAVTTERRRGDDDPWTQQSQSESQSQDLISDDHVCVSWLKKNHTFRAATDWAKHHFRQGVSGRPALFTASQATQSRTFLLQVAAIALCGEYPEAWVAEALEAMRRLKKPPGNPGGYLRKLLRASPHIRGRPDGWFDALLKAIEVPDS